MSSPAEDLDALGIDHAFMRWDAVRQYMQQLENSFLLRLDRLLISLLVEGKAYENADRIGRYPWISLTDVQDSVRWAKYHILGETA